jgi:uncharacterized C2H2 Zn-finger protein
MVISHKSEDRLNEQKLRCPNCHGADIRHSLPRGILDSIMLSFGRSPFRCRRCERRFYQNTAIDRHQPSGETPADSER